MTFQPWSLLYAALEIGLFCVSYGFKAFGTGTQSAWVAATLMALVTITHLIRIKCSGLGLRGYLFPGVFCEGVDLDLHLDDEDDELVRAPVQRQRRARQDQAWFAPPSVCGMEYFRPGFYSNAVLYLTYGVFMASTFVPLLFVATTAIGTTPSVGSAGWGPIFQEAPLGNGVYKFSDEHDYAHRRMNQPLNLTLASCFQHAQSRHWRQSSVYGWSTLCNLPGVYAELYAFIPAAALLVVFGCVTLFPPSPMASNTARELLHEWRSDPRTPAGSPALRDYVLQKHHILTSVFNTTTTLDLVAAVFGLLTACWFLFATAVAYMTNDAICVYMAEHATDTMGHINNDWKVAILLGMGEDQIDYVKRTWFYTFYTHFVVFAAHAALYFFAVFPASQGVRICNSRLSFLYKATKKNMETLAQRSRAEQSLISAQAYVAIFERWLATRNFIITHDNQSYFDSFNKLLIGCVLLFCVVVAAEVPGMWGFRGVLFDQTQLGPRITNFTGPHGYGEGTAYSTCSNVHTPMQGIAMQVLPVYFTVSLVIQAVQSHSLTRRQQDDLVFQHMLAAGKTDVYARLNLKGADHANFFMYMKLLERRLETGGGQGPRLCGLPITPAVRSSVIAVAGSAAVSMATLAVTLGKRL